MDTTRVDFLPRLATTARSRRGALVRASAALLALAAAPDLGQAKKGKGKGKKAKKRVKQTCQRQIGACRTFFTELCATDPDCNDEEIEGIYPCCDLLKNCQAGASVDCFFALLAG